MRIEMITLEQYWMGRDKLYPLQLKQEYISNATDLLARVNLLLEEMGRTNVGVNSGWRPPAINKQVGGAVKSNHMTGNAIDLSDDDGSIDIWCTNNIFHLKAQGLYMEHPSKTPRWCHLQRIPPRSGNTIFMP